MSEKKQQQDFSEKLAQAVFDQAWADIEDFAPKAGLAGCKHAWVMMSRDLQAEWRVVREAIADTLRKERRKKTRRAPNRLPWAPGAEQEALAEAKARAAAAMLRVIEADESKPFHSPDELERLLDMDSEMVNEQVDFIVRASRKDTLNNPWGWFLGRCDWRWVDPSLAALFAREIQSGPGLSSARDEFSHASTLLSQGQWAAARAWIEKLSPEVFAEGETRDSLLRGAVCERGGQGEGRRAAPNPEGAPQWQEGLLLARELGVPLDERAVRALTLNGPEDLEGALDWLAAQGDLTPEAMSRALAAVPANSSLMGAEKPVDAAIGWLLKNGADLDEGGWAALAAGDPAPFKKIAQHRQIKNPARALLAAAKSQIDDRGGLVPWLCKFRPWSGEERADALVAAMESNRSQKIKMTALLAAGPFSPEQLGRALEAYASFMRSHDWEVGQKLLNLGADARGSDGRGEPLKLALKTESFELARAIADAGGWGPVAQKWLLQKRANPSVEMLDWMGEAKARQEAAHLQKALAAAKKKAAGNAKGTALAPSAGRAAAQAGQQEGQRGRAETRPGAGAAAPSAAEAASPRARRRL